MSNCETCMNYEYDEEFDYYVCMKDLDDDEMYRFIKGNYLVGMMWSLFMKQKNFEIIRLRV